jgi:hypothetical protein
MLLCCVLNLKMERSISMGPNDISSPIRGTSFGIDPEETTYPLSPEEASLSSTGPYRYSNEPPIKEVSPDDMAGVAENFIGSIGEYSTDNQGSPVSAALSQDPPAAERWVRRSDDAKAIALDIGNVTNSDSEFGDDSEDSMVKGFSYNIGDDSVALMALEQHITSGTEITHLVTHPGTSGAGKTMVEKAVNESQAAGIHGKVWVSKISDDSDRFYDSLGFKTSGGGRMELNPSESRHLWSEGQDGKWSLKEHAGSGFLSKKKENESSQASGSKRPREDEDDEAPNAKRLRAF